MALGLGRRCVVLVRGRLNIEPQTERYCHLLIGLSLVLSTVGIGYLVVFNTTLANCLVIMAGLGLGRVAFLYCLGNASFWG